MCGHVFYNFELLRCYVCTIQFLVVLYYEIGQQLKFPARMNKVLCYRCGIFFFVDVSNVCSDWLEIVFLCVSIVFSN